MSIAPEFVTLCRAQIRLLADSCGATSLAVYYAPIHGAEIQSGELVPIAFYPEAMGDDRLTLSPAAMEDMVDDRTTDLPVAFAEETIAGDVAAVTIPVEPLLLPLANGSDILGLLYIDRPNRPWQDSEKEQIDRVVTTLGAACALEKQRSLTIVDLRRSYQLQSGQVSVLHNFLHQLRNPLAAIKTWSKLVLKKMTESDPNLTAVQSIVRESDRLQKLLEQLEGLFPNEEIFLPEVSSSNFSTNPFSNGLDRLLPAPALVLQPTELIPILQPLITNAIAIATERNLNFISHISPHLPLVNIAPLAIQEIFSNLLDNAIKYTPDGGEIEVTIEPFLERVEIAIADTGYGIPSQDLPNLFRRHYRGIQAEGDIPGTGLGLAIVKELIDAMAGTIEVESPYFQGKGTCFTVSFPISHE